MEGVYLYKELSYKLVGICMEIHRLYGNGHHERIYHNAFVEKLKLNNVKFVSKPKIVIYSKDTGDKLGYYEPDLIIENKIIAELKAKPAIIKQFEKQLSEYIKTSVYEVGYLFNFGLPSLYFKRIIYTNNNKKLDLNN